MNLRLTEEADRVLSALAREDGVSKNEEINRAILDRGAWVSHEKKVRAEVREAISNYAPSAPSAPLAPVAPVAPPTPPTPPAPPAPLAPVAPVAPLPGRQVQ